MAEVREQPTEVEGTLTTRTCFRCKKSVTTWVTKGKNSFSCRPCHALANFSSKLEWPEELKLGPQERESFYARSAACVENGRVSLERVRAEVGKVLVTRLEESSTTGGEGRYFPLKYYADRGYDTEDIEKNAPWQMQGNVCTYFVRVPVVLDSVTVSKVQQQTLSLTFKAKRQRVQGAATGSEAAEQEDLELDLTEDELEAFGSSSKEAKRAAKKKAREDAKEAKRLEKADKKERATKNKKAQTLCSKANVQLAAALRDLEKAQQKATKAKATKLVLDNLREQTRVLTTWKKKAVDGVLHFAKQGLEGPEYELPFDDQVLKDELTSVKFVVKNSGRKPREDTVLTAADDEDDAEPGEQQEQPAS